MAKVVIAQSGVGSSQETVTIHVGFGDPVRRVRFLDSDRSPQDGTDSETRMPNYWFTTHWPHPVDREHPWNIYLPDKPRSERVGRQIAVGDVVVFYETGSGKDEAGKPPLPKGRTGVIAMGEVTGKLRERHVTLQHSDGTTSAWAWEIPCARHDFGGFCSSREAATALGSPGYKFRGVGGGLGIMKIEPDKYERIRRCFKTNPPPPIHLRKPR